MSNGKKNKTKKNKGVPKNIQSINVILPENITPDEMQHIIANAILESEEIKIKKEEELRLEKLAKWHKIIGYKKNESKFKDALNKFKVFIRILFLPKEHIEGDRAFLTLLIMIIQSFLTLVKWILIFLSTAYFIYPIFQLLKITPSVQWSENVLYVLYGIIAFVFSRLFRMASIEIEKIEDRNYIFSIFASVTSVISIVIAVIAITKGG